MADFDAQYLCLCPDVETASSSISTGGGIPKASIEDESLGVDIWLDLSAASGPDRVVTPKGDWLLARGREAYRQSLLRRFITAPGDWKTKPGYGAGLLEFVKAKNTPSNRDLIATRIRAQALSDSRTKVVESINVTMSDGMLKFAVVIVPKFDGAPVTVEGQVS